MFEDNTNDEGFQLIIRRSLYKVKIQEDDEIKVIFAVDLDSVIGDLDANV